MFQQILRTFSATVLMGVIFCGAALSQESTIDTHAPPVSGIVADHATLSVENIPAEADWYEHVLGFKVSAKINQDPHMSSWRMVIPGFRIDLIQYKGSTRPAPVDPIYLRQGWIHVVFRVPDIAKAIAELQALHVQADVNKDSKGNPIQIILHDPEGNEVRIRPVLAG